MTCRAGLKPSDLLDHTRVGADLRSRHGRTSSQLRAEDALNEADFAGSGTAQERWQHTDAYMRDVQQAFRTRPAVRVQGNERFMKLLLVSSTSQRLQAPQDIRAAQREHVRVFQVKQPHRSRLTAVQDVGGCGRVVGSWRGVCIVGGRARPGQGAVHKEHLCALLRRQRPARQQLRSRDSP